MVAKRPTVAVLDIGAGDAQSLVAALQDAGALATVTRDRDLIANADGLVVAGDGEFAEMMGHLRETRGDELIERRLAGGRPVLAIGVAMHAMFDGAFVEDAVVDGLAQWPGIVSELNGPNALHTGWSSVDVAADSALFADIEDQTFYLAHSAVVKEWTLEVYGAFASPRVTYATNGERFIAAVENGPLSATQFHPENSGEAGRQLLRNWISTL